MTTTNETHKTHIKDFYIWENVSARLFEITSDISKNTPKNILQHRVKEIKTLIEHYDNSHQTWKNDIPSDKYHKAERYSKQLHAIVEKISGLY
jgi:cytolysin (calcineurin-like family phosphatase)